ncbi:SDR family NAD(P)-dependent oxidoreductase [Azospirillum agricola]|uniref:SDR family NAD(P)-dependent oxidoreductase n=1 Tax=Azospirillum agricola TaxID=1720247 RepID=UPI000A0EF805|nr:SDR family oxidoreductase [Azospirillum agricola]SMH39511.1 NAD(P)-dependent dehydrogenase, short-chain alcohol dehydrogenase family [Azospirillum lipoferum]
MSVALVTGGGGGIGRATAVRLAEGGADVAVADVDEGLGNETARLVEAAGRRALFVRADVSDGAQVAACVDAVERRLGPITAFANNAGIEGVVAPIHLYPDEVFDRLFQVNAKGVFLGLKHVLARMIPRGTGAIVNTASTSAIRGRAGLAGYVATKHAVLGLTRVAALDVAGTGVRVNAVLPGPVETRMIRSLDEQAQRSGGIRRAGGTAYGQPGDVAGVIAFLLSDQAAHVNGAAWTVDDGATVA